MNAPVGRSRTEVRNLLRALARALLAALVVWCATAGPAAAQAVKGTLLGTNNSRTAATNPSGHYVFANLKDGIYRVEAELSGFKKVVRDNVKLDVNTTVRVDLALPVGNLEESITVVEQKAVLQTDRADTGRLIESKQLTETPLAFNRNFQGLLITVPGATRPFRPHSQFFNSQDSLSTQVNGQSRLANNVMLEGIDNNHKTGLLTVLIPSADALEAVSVSTSNYDA